ncbi:efflux RND transporter periplasmic adaptor subunit [Caulobacter sp. BK020]|uniref:efflux RND transporter periplasmic adaptor subunit n=1 Tax=Caulobacter sp. BK020 TaxID=2512117 RepID=UPI00104FFAAF|nr:efflux RND transporter periplasmic adaptor subunit [Caulobacter sp. BK020]TCS14933.1 HlyD family secretion protein [Caulobacter sp. BK020]
MILLKKLLAGGLIVAAVAPALSGCHKAQHPPAARAAELRSVSVITLAPHAVAGALTATGDLVPREEAAVTPEVSGYRVTTVLADVGDTVRQGQVLARLDPALIEAQIAQQSALVAQAEAQAAQAQDQASRTNGLDGSGDLAQEQINQRRFQAKAAGATAQAQRAALRDLQVRREKLSVTAPVGGVVLERTVRPGDAASAGGTAWFRLARDGQVELQAQLAEAELARIRVGQSARVTLPSGAIAIGRVRLVSPQIDPKSKLGYVRLTLPVRPDIRSGGFGRAVFGDAADQGLAVPEAAIRYDAGGASIMVMEAGDRVRRVPVKTGDRGGGWVRLTAGPAAGARVVANAATLLVDGDRVRPVASAGANL